VGGRIAGLDADRSRRKRLFVVAAHHLRPDMGTELIGSWPMAQVQMTEESYPRKAGPVPLGAWRAIRFELRDREPAMLQPFGREVDDLLQARRAAQPADRQHGARWEALAEVALMTTSRGPLEEDVIRAMGVSEEGISWLWRR
jgi:hypothetical protein